MSPPTPLKRKYPRPLRVGNTTYQVTRLQPEDADDLLRFARALDEPDLLFLRSDITQPEVVARMIADQENDLRITLVARSDGELMGYAGLNRDPLSWTRHLGEIRTIVASSHRGEGVGAALVGELLAISRELDLRKVIARMPLRQAGARRMFEKLGFSAEALLADWVVDRDDTTHDLVVMSHDVTSLTDG